MLSPARFLLPLLLGGGLPVGAQETVAFRDGFSTYPVGSDGAPRWLTDAIDWEVRDGALTFGGAPPGFAVAGEGDWYRRVTVEAALNLTAGRGDSWKVAGVAVHADPRNFWHLALVEAPDGRHYVELAEMLEGEWLSQTKLELVVHESAPANAWEYGVPYRMRIALDPEGVAGAITGPDGRVLHRLGYRFSAAAVTYGRAALRSSSLAGSFDDVEVSMADPMPRPEAPEPPAFEVAAGQDVIGEATGFYRVQEVSGVWWVVDPRGRRFYAVGTDHCRMSGHWCEKLGYAPYGRNMEAKHDSREAWARSATDRLRAWGFNLLGAGGGEEAFYKGLAHTQFAAFGTTFSDVADLCPKTTWTGFPNVFDPRWERYCDKLARRACVPNREDPWLFGYFLDNELEWYGKTYQPWGLFAETMKKPRDHSGKVALVAFLRERYETIDRFNAAWRTQAGSFDALLDRQALDGSAPEAQQATLDFVRLVADRYFAVTTAAIRKHDPNHMVIGCRFAGDAPAGIWDIAGKYCDVVTFNYYGNVDLEAGEAPGLAERFTDYFRQARRPLMITEWSFPALDSGLPCTAGAGQRFDTQAQRAQAFDIFQRLVFGLPFMVGSDYFMWVDEPALGISSTFPEDSNYGLVNEQDVPYPELTQTAARLNAQVQDLHAQGMADLEVGEISVTDRGFTVALTNRGLGGVETEVLLSVDGREERRSLRLAAKATERVSVSQTWTPGGHLLVAQVDPDRKLSCVSRAEDRRAAACVTPGLPWPEQTARGTRRIALLVANPTAERIARAPVSVRLQELAGIAWDKVDRSQVYVLRSNGEPLAAQIDPTGEALTAGSELSFVLPDLAPGACETCLVTIVPAAQERREALCAGFSEIAGGFTLSSPLDDGRALKLSTGKGTGDVVEQIALGDTLLGSYNPLIWQYPGQNQWVRTDRFEGVEASVGPVRVRLRLSASYGGRPGVITTVDDQGRQAAAQARPVPFRVTHEVLVYPGRAEFRCRFVSIDNLGDRPLQLSGYFFYLNSAIGGSPEGDTVASPAVPNYYAGGQGAWRDAVAGWLLGAEAQPGSALQVHFFQDPGGMQHPDARKQFETPVVVAPGETYSERDAPWLVVYAAPAEGTPWRDIRQRLIACSQVLVRAGELERR